jgi:Outer membrane receptor for ferrienterochelin and colicins
MSRKISLLITCLLVATNISLAQVEQGAITGLVVDPTGASIANAKVSATNQATGTVATAQTTEDGYYKLPYLAAGKYNLAVERDGFSINRVTNVPVLVGQSATINITLKPGTLHEEVTVSANAVQIDQVSSSMGYVVSTTQIIELPTNRSPYSMMTLSPGVIAVGNTGTGPIVSGGRSNTSAILFDGQDTRNNSTLDNAYTPPQETIGEVRFITNNFSAEYGRSAGGVLVAAGKSGGNQWHGALYDYLKNDKLNANSWVNNRAGTLRPRQRHNEYGFAISGPVDIPHVYDGRNKTFFLFNYEQINDHGANQQNLTVPTALQRAGDFSQTFTSSGQLIKIYDPLTTVPDPTSKSGYSRSQFPNNVIPPNRIDPIAKKILSYIPEPTLGVSPLLLPNWTGTFPQITHTDKWFGRADQNFGTKNRLFFRYGYQTSPRTSPFTNIAFPGEGTNGGGNQQSFAHTAALSDTHMFSPNLFGEFRFGYTRSVIKLTPLSVGFDITSLGLPQYLKNASADAIFPRINLNGEFTPLAPIAPLTTSMPKLHPKYRRTSPG